MIHLHALGASVIQVGDTRFIPGSLRSFSLLLYLIAEHGTLVPRSHLHSLIFPDQNERNAAHSLRQLVYKLRVAGARFEPNADGVMLCEDGIRVDVTDAVVTERFNIEQLRTIQGGLLPGFAPAFSEQFADWLDGYRARSSRALCRVLIRQLSNARASGDYKEMEHTARACLALDPLNDEATLGLAETLALTGSKAAAVQLLDRYIADIGPGGKDLCVPANVLRRRIGERFPTSPYRPGFELPFLGRGTEMQLLSTRFRSVRGGESHCAVVCGEAGIGKSRLAAEFARIAILDGARVARLATQPQDVHRPIGAFVDLVPLLLEFPGALGCSPESMQALTRLTTHNSDASGDLFEHAHESEHLFYTITQAISDLVDAITAESPLVVTIEDVHWLDPMSLRVLGNLVSERKYRRLLVLLTCREPSPLRLTARHADRASTIPLSRLPDDVTGTLVTSAVGREGAEVDAELRDWMTVASAGNPLFVTALSLHYAATRQRFSVAPVLQSVLEGRLQALSAQARTVLVACVALGKSCTIARLITILDLSRTELLSAMAELEVAWLIVCVNNQIEVPHAVVADIVIRGATPLALQLARHRVAELLETEALELGSAAKLWECAEKWIEVGDFQRALSILRHCARHSLDIGRPREAAEVLLRAAELPLSGDVRQAAARDAVIAADAGSESAHVLRGIKLVRETGCPVDHDDIELAELSALIQVLENLDSIATRLLCCVRSGTADHRRRAGILLVKLADEQAQPDLARETHRLLTPLFSTSTSAGYEHFEFLMILHAAIGQLDDAAEMARRLMARSDSAGAALAARLQANAGFALWRAGFVPDALACLETSYQSAVVAGLQRPRLLIAAQLASHYWDLGDAVVSRQWLATADKVVEANGELATVPLYLTTHIGMALDEGRVEAAKLLHRSALASNAFSGRGRASRWLHASMLRLRQLEGGMGDKHAPTHSTVVSNSGQFLIANPSDLEVEVAWHALNGAGQAADARQMLKCYLEGVRSDRHPLSYGIQQLVNKPGANSPI